MTTALHVDDLGDLGEELGSGGQAVVYDLPHLTLPRTPGRLVYKRYKPGVVPLERNMHELIDLRDNLDEPRRQRLDTVTAWPLRLVSDDHGVRGVVLPRIPDPFFQRITLPSGSPRTTVREVQHLFVDAEKCDRIGMPVPTLEQRLEICRDVAGVLAFLHDPGIDVVFGDINAKNELFRLGEEPTVMFVDCDAARPRGSVTGTFQLNAPDWAPPERSGALSRHTDVFKLGLFVLRCLTPGDQGSTRTDPDAAVDVLDAEGLALLRRAIDGRPAERPEAGDWLRYLSRAIGQPMDPPSLDLVEIGRTVVVRGEPLTVRWTAVGADVVEVSGPGCPTVVADARPGSGSIEVRPVRGGSLTVTARNKAGAVDVRTPPVAVVDVTRWADLPVPAPRLDLPDHLPALPDVSAVLALPVPGTPRVEVSAEPVPPPPGFGMVPLPAVLVARDDVLTPQDTVPVAVDLAEIFLSGPDFGLSPARKGAYR